MPQDIQRPELRKLLNDVRNYDKSVEQGADWIINYINQNYDLKKK